MGAYKSSHAIEAQANLIRQIYKAQPELFLRELCYRLAKWKQGRLAALVTAGSDGPP